MAMYIWLPCGKEVKNPPAMPETQVRSLGREDPLEEEMATHSSILVTELPGRRQPIGSQRVRHNRAHLCIGIYIYIYIYIEREREREREKGTGPE